MSIHLLKFAKPELKDQFFDKKKTDPRLRAFVAEAIDNFPDNDWTMTSGRRFPFNEKSGHHREILSAMDFRSRTWTEKQLTEFKNWIYFWWEDRPNLFDVLIEDGRFDPKYAAEEPHIHIEINPPYWRTV